MRTRAPLTSRAPSPTTSTFATSRATSALGASTRLQRAPQRVKPRMAHRTTGLPHGTWPAWPSAASATICARPYPPALCPCRAGCSFPMRRRQRLQLRRVLQPCRHRFNLVTIDSWLSHALRARCELLQYNGAVLHRRAGTYPLARYFSAPVAPAHFPHTAPLC